MVDAVVASKAHDSGLHGGAFDIQLRQFADDGLIQREVALTVGFIQVDQQHFG
jgi:hypothetical protein